MCSAYGHMNAFAMGHSESMDVPQQQLNPRGKPGPRTRAHEIENAHAFVLSCNAYLEVRI